MDEISEAFIQNIIKLGEGSIQEQLQASTRVCTKIFPGGICVDGNASLKLLSTFVKWLSSEKKSLQQDACFYINHITKISDDNRTENEYTQLVIDAEAVPPLIQLLSSPDVTIVEDSLKCLDAIALYFPSKIVENRVLQPLIRCLKSSDTQVAHHAVVLIGTLAYDGQRVHERNVRSMVEAEAVTHLIKLLSSKNLDTCSEALDLLITIAAFNAEFCQNVLDYGALELVKKLLTVKPSSRGKKGSKRNAGADATDLYKKLAIKLLAVEFIHEVTKYEEDPMDIVIDEGVVPLIIKQINTGENDQIKLESVKAFRNIIKYRPGHVSNLINNNKGASNIVNLICNNLMNDNVEFVLTHFSALDDILSIAECQIFAVQKLKSSVAPAVIRSFIDHENEEIKQLSNGIITKFVDTELPPLNGRNFKSETISEDDDLVSPPAKRKRKRPYASVKGELNKRSKRLNKPVVQPNLEESVMIIEEDNGLTSANNTSQMITRSKKAKIFQQQESVDVSVLILDDFGGFPFTNPSSVVHPGTSVSPVLPTFPVTKTELIDNQPVNNLNNLPRQPPALPFTVSLLPCATTAEAINATTVNDNALQTSSGLPSILPVLPLAGSLEATNATALNDAASTNPSCLSSVLPSLQVATETVNATVLNDNSSQISSCLLSVLPVLPPGATSITAVNSPTLNDKVLITPSLLRPVLSIVPPVSSPTEAIDEKPGTEIAVPSVKYFCPSEAFLDKCCNHFGLEFNYIYYYTKFWRRFEYRQIFSDSIPDEHLPLKNKFGFNCFSKFFTGREDFAYIIKEKLNQYFYDENDAIKEKENIKKVLFSSTLTSEHLKTVAALFKCRIMVYCNETWERYGNWDSENEEYFPLFVMEKKQNEDGVTFEIVLSLKNAAVVL